MLDELRDMYRGVATHATKDDEHAAALELLLIVMRADGRLRLNEFEEIEAFTTDQEWESDTFSLSNRLGPAVARVRDAFQIDSGVDALLDDIDERIGSRVLRAALVGAARTVADADGTRAASEDRVLAKIIERLG